MTAPPYMLLQASANAIPLRDESVQCVVTSPPYWGLRQYAGEQRLVWGGEEECQCESTVTTAGSTTSTPSAARVTRAGSTTCATSSHHRHSWGDERLLSQRIRNGAPGGLHEGREVNNLPVYVDIPSGAFCACGAWYGALGLEPTPELYVEHMVEVFREVRRVLRKDGTLWLNLGDSFAGSWGAQGRRESTANGDSISRNQIENHPRFAKNTGSIRGDLDLKPKDLIMIPHRVAIALQADGWWVRMDNVWSKPNPMPESITDRPTKSHEYVFLLTKSERYYYDADAIREPVAESSIQRVSQNGGRPKFDAARARREGGHITGRDTLRADQLVPAGGRNARSVWEIATTPYPGAHFATFPEELPRRCILAGSSQQACGVCGAPWERVTERVGIQSRAVGKALDKRAAGLRTQFSGAQPGSPTSPTVTTVGWRPTCGHADGSGRSLVLDPFNGSGTTGAVAVRLGRAYVGLDISAEYLREQAVARIDPLGAAALAAIDAVDSGDEAQGVLAL